SQQATTRNRGKAIVNSLQSIYDQEPSMVTEDDETSKDKEIDKLMALISLSFKIIYKPTNNNLRTSSNTNVEMITLSGEHLDTLLETKLDEVIKSSVEDLVPIPSESEGILDNMCDVPFSNKNLFDAESDLIESLLTQDTLIVYSPKIDSLLEEFASELAYINPILSGINETVLTLSFPSHKDHRKYKEEDEMKMRKNLRERNKLKTKLYFKN
nr:hypothetical protein [Tanacetum cinerariifolium]